MAASDITQPLLSRSKNAGDQDSYTSFPESDGYGKEDEKRVLQKLDRNLLPLMFVLYSLNVLDRSSLGNARIAGLQDDIDIAGSRYTWLATSFYVSYIVFQFLAAGWKLFPPHIWVSWAVLFWGTVATAQAFVTSYPALLVLRSLLGIAEAMFGPGVGLYFSYFYPRRYIGFRLGIFLSGAALANAYGGFLAYAIAHVETQEIRGWRMLFLAEGVPTILLIPAVYFFLPDGPRSARFLDGKDRDILAAMHGAEQRKAEGAGGDDGEERFEAKEMLAAFGDVKALLTAGMYFSCNVSFAALPMFLPTIITSLVGAGDEPLSPLVANGLSAPPYLLCFFTILFVSFLSDRLQQRGLFIVSAALVASLGFLVLAAFSSPVVRYVGIFLAVNIFVSIAVILPWVANNTRSHSSRVGGFWVMQTIGQCGPLMGMYVFNERQAPGFGGALVACAGFCAVVAALGMALRAVLRTKNERLERARGAEDFRYVL